MIQTVKKSPPRRAPWIARATELIDEIAGWSAAKGWNVKREEVSHAEELPRDLRLFALRIVTGPRSELYIEARALDERYSVGWIDLNAYPTMARVQLQPKRGRWEIMTDSRVPLPQPFDKQMFYHLVRHMLG